MKAQKIKNYDEKTLVILGLITIIIGIVFISTTIKKAEAINNLNVLAFKEFCNKHLKLYDLVIPRDSVIIVGYKKEVVQRVFDQLNKSTKLELQIDSISGKVTVKEGKVQTKADSVLLEAIESESILVRIKATDSNFDENDNWFVGGGFKGSKDKGIRVITNQIVNPRHTKKTDEFLKVTNGVSILHEVLESYIGGLDSPGSPEPEPNNTDSPGYVNYFHAHDQAIKLDPRFVKYIWNYRSNGIYIINPKSGDTSKVINDLSKQKQKFKK